MIIPLEPKLEGLAERRFFGFARRLLERQAVGDADRIGALVESETAEAPQLSDLRGQCDEYTASVRVLGDLAQLRWRMVDSGYGLELHSPHPQDKRVSGPAQVRQRKEAIRSELRPRVRQQLSEANVRKFIRRMESPGPSSKRESIRTLIADGAELQERLSAAHQTSPDDPTRAETLRCAVQPYLQLVDGSSPDIYTGIPLSEIWRYFRYTWSIPQTPIPGRHLHYLVRDAAHGAHAVIGIAALSNCAVQVVSRDRAIGWSTSGLVAALTTLFAPHKERAEREASDPALRFHGAYQWLKPKFQPGIDPSPADKRGALRFVTEWLLQGVATGIGEIQCQGLATDEELATPTPEIVQRLRRLGNEFASLRQEALAGQETGDASIESNIPVDDDVLNLESNHSSNVRIQSSRRMLVRKKRAFELARLLDSRRVLTANREELVDPATALSVIHRKEVRIAINTAFSAIKSQRIGTNLLEITTCGAVAPYNRMLGGKLVALLLLSPEVASDNQSRYGQEPTIIRSQLKNTPVVPDNSLVWLGTTSLFSHGSSQYERLRLPAGVIAPDQPEIRYTHLGETSGYGTIQFADETVRALESVLKRKRGYRDVNSVFGEGASPRLRKLRTGLDAIGFSADRIMQHHQERRVYGVPLCPRAGAYLCGLAPDVPQYITAPGSYTDATERIAEFWRRRWLSSRLSHSDSWAALGQTRPWLLSSAISQSESPSRGAEDGGGVGGEESDDGDHPDDKQRLEFWRRLAQAGSNAISEGLTDKEFGSLHIQTELEDHLIEIARKGRSIVLTGNAGDGKTHLARMLRHRLESDRYRFEYAFDATAIMNSREGVGPIVERWRQARKKGRHLILAINQYPLYMLRQEFQRTLPDVSREIEEQWGARLTEGAVEGCPAGDSLLLVDLSLRNPLSREFAHKILDKMLADPAVKRHAAGGTDPNFSSNFRCLVNATVQGRLFELYNRLISSGLRTTIRELWIVTARLLFAPSATDDVPGSLRALYSERLFAPDERFPLSQALRSVADPAEVSHPLVDRHLEDRQCLQAGEWLVGDGAPDPLPSPASAGGVNSDNYRRRFVALKRRFYFEHSQGASIFDLAPSSDAAFHKLLEDSISGETDPSRLMEAINLCYFPFRFEGIEDKLCLWIGHRLDEQPTKSFVAGEFIPSNRLGIRLPRPHGGLKDAFNYKPDHLYLVAKGLNAAAAAHEELRIDAALYRTLSAISQGLPRHLINPGELNRLDTFVDRLRRVDPVRLPEFLVYNAEHVAFSSVRMSTSFKRYLRTRRL